MEISLAGMSKSFVTVAIAAAVVLGGVKAYADNANDIEQFYGNNANVTWDSSPIVTAIGSQPGVFGGHTFTGWSIFAADTSPGSMDVFVSASTLAALPGAPSSFSVGDMLKLNGQWSPFHSLPEIAFSSVAASNNFINTLSTGNTVPAAPAFSVSALTSSGMGANYQPGSLSIAGYYLEITNAVITSSIGMTTLPSYNSNISSETFTIADSTGSMTCFDWTTSYSASTQLAGTPIGNGYTYDVFGFVSYNGTTGPMEFTPLAVVPEPSTLVLAGLGMIGGLLALRRRRS
ncbi:MAG TPA: PEP-CTERM sorting domain-containing protein [Verrucomicrobiae bacterium]|nr:PEP-CTERM sorting domain-containing protein [Verrucomicrobiae bacterium]